MRHVISSISLFLVCIIALAGCGSSSTADSGQATTVAKSAKASFSVTIPTKVTKSLIPNGTSYVYINWTPQGPTAGTYVPGELYLYPDASGVAAGSVDLIPGYYEFDAYCYDSAGSLLSSASSIAQIASGANNIKITFINGRWTFASPLVLSQGEILSSFDIFPAMNLNSGQYPITWNVVDSTNTPLNPSGYMDFMSISGDLSLLSYMLNFPTISAGSQLDILSVEYNITQQSSNSTWATGDRVVVATSMGPAPSGVSSSPDVTTYFNTKFTNGTNLTGTLIEFTYGTYSYKQASKTTGLCSMQYPYKRASLRSAALASEVSSKAIKSSISGTSLGNVTLTYPSCEYIHVGGEPFTDTNGNGYYDYTPTPEPFTDSNGNGYYDPGMPSNTEVTVTETLSNVLVYPFTATGADIPTQIVAKPVRK